MSTKTDATTSSKFDTIKWLLVMVLLGTGIFGFYTFAEYSLLLRVVILLGIVGISIFIALQTDKGRRTKDFLQQTHVEVRKVVWPTRQETLQMTGIVLIMVLLVAIIIWGLDSFLFWLVRLFTGQGG
ncbi:MAG: preprotein translocase subunit SecE [Gammaproteobacteria bacterium]|nr:MAG: preprotein translocase subunit SecE [Gammaproteobacteria bacterium]RKZ41037.1 MAG: preprotein translocase subunit SecE [Gammaproteobacteria bacterium]RKZ75419.1 MAG: preprotein translocase subunit SecE [Gammaproteobacteria bacterium]